MQHNITHYINKEMGSDYNSSASTSNVIKEDFDLVADLPDFEELKECSNRKMDQRDLERIEEITKDLMRECDEMERENHCLWPQVGM